MYVFEQIYRNNVHLNSYEPNLISPDGQFESLTQFEIITDTQLLRVIAKLRDSS